MEARGPFDFGQLRSWPCHEKRRAGQHGDIIVDADGNIIVRFKRKTGRAFWRVCDSKNRTLDLPGMGRRLC
jgi:hypothetical protein